MTRYKNKRIQIRRSLPTQQTQRQRGPHTGPAIDSVAQGRTYPALVQRARANPHTLGQVDVLQLQRMIGNRAVGALLAQTRPGPEQEERSSALRVGPAYDAHEREARQNAAQVGGPHVLQRASESSSTAELGAAGGALSNQLENKIQTAKSGGRPVPDQVRLAMEKKTGADYRGVRVFENKNAQEANAALGARAFTQGKHIFLGRNQSPHNVQLMAHELTHTAQQGAVKMANNTKAASTPAGVPGIQRNEDLEELKKQRRKNRAKRFGLGMAKGGLKALDILTLLPFHVIDQLSVADLHIKDLYRFIKTRKTRSQRNEGAGVSMKFGRGTAKRAMGRTGLTGYIKGYQSHSAMYGAGGKQDYSIPGWGKIGKRGPGGRALGGISPWSWLQQLQGNVNAKDRDVVSDLKGVNTKIGGLEQEEELAGLESMASALDEDEDSFG